MQDEKQTILTRLRSVDPKRLFSSVIVFLFGKPLPLERETSLFILVSALDALMTYVLLRHSAEGRTSYLITEGNAIARYFLYHWGVKGLVTFKFILVAVVTVLAQLIAIRREDIARWILNIGTIVASFVVVYSLWLLFRAAF